MHIDTQELSPAGRRYGLFRDNLANPARVRLALSVPAAFKLPPSASTSQWMGPIRDQGQEGSCTGQMAAGIRDMLYRKLYLFEKTKTVAPEAFECSASFIYKCNLLADGNLGVDAGSSIHQSFITLNQKGAPLETEEPYSDKDFSIAPSLWQYSEAANFVGGAYHYLPTLNEIKASIASGYSVGFGIDVYESFESEWSKPGFMPLPKPGERLLGGHAQHGVNYDDTIEFPDGSKGGVLVQNSWGSSWGVSAPGRTDGGCYWMPYAFFAENVTDCWMMHLGGAWAN
jgi:C1A family cysteine protease